MTTLSAFFVRAARMVPYKEGARHLFLLIKKEGQQIQDLLASYEKKKVFQKALLLWFLFYPIIMANV